ncbi:hypothetical protein C2E23DRAFT_894507 [Lenzites betulinus]|nr:hypothetical protein C2E23DRAFT_894507 [Lenzites betulinus]
MSSRYNLRRPRAASPPVTTPTTEDIPGEHLNSHSLSSDAPAGSSPLTSVVTPESPRLGAERRPGLTYSQVVASRSPSPSFNAGAETFGSEANNISHYDTPPPETEGTATEPVGRHPVTVEDVTDEDENGPWTPVVRRRRTRSTGSMPLPRDVPPRQHPRLSTAQQATVHKAEERLAQSEREWIARRAATSLNAINRISSESTTSRGEGPSKPMPKGKTIDARNWGGINIPEHELDPEAQQLTSSMKCWITGGLGKVPNRQGARQALR